MTAFLLAVGRLIMNQSNNDDLEERRRKCQDTALLFQQLNKLPSENAKELARKLLMWATPRPTEGHQSTELVSIEDLWELFVELVKDLHLKEIFKMEEFSEFKKTMSG